MARNPGSRVWADVVDRLTKRDIADGNYDVLTAAHLPAGVTWLTLYVSGA